MGCQRWQATMIARRRVVIAPAGGALAVQTSHAQKPRRLWRIGLLELASKPYQIDGGYLSAFVAGMRELGYEPDKDFVFEERFANGDSGRLPALAAELVRAGVELLITSGTQANRAALQSSTTIPIVTTAEADPVGNGFAVSLSHPGKNITGLATLLAETIVKNFELLCVMVPKRARIGLLNNPRNPGHKAQLANLQAAANKLGVTIAPVDATSVDEIERAVATMPRDGIQAFMTLPDRFFSQQVQQIAQLSLKHRLISSFYRPEYPDAGGLMSHGQDLLGNWRRAAMFADRIFKGAKAGDLPFEQPTIFELVVNLKTARELGISVPQSVQVQATRLIE